MIEKINKFDDFNAELAINALQEHYTINEPKSLTDAFERCFRNKKWIKDYFGDSLIIRKEFIVSEESDFEARKNVQNEIVMNIMDELEIKNNYGLKSFLLNYCDLSKNKVLENYTTYSNKSRKIPKGANVSRSLKYFIVEKDLLRKFQDLLSQLIQKSSYEGKKYYMYLSIHPSDFLTISDNTKNWTSCHSLREDYYFGNFTYLADKTTLVAYVLDTKDEFDNNIFDVNTNYDLGYKWNSKLWRSLVHVTRDENENLAMLINKQYPFKSHSFNDELKLMIEEVFDFCNYSSDTVCSSEVFRIGTGGDMIFFDPMQSSDFSAFTRHDPEFSFSKLTTIAESIKCVNCGFEDASDGEYGTCESCTELFSDEDDDDYSCSICGHYFHISELNESRKDGYICDSCFQDKKYEICSMCHYVYPLSTMHQRTVELGSHQYTVNTCKRCQERQRRSENEQEDCI